MIDEIILIIAVAIIAGVSAYLGAERAINKKRFIVKVDKESEEITLEPVVKAKKVEFVGEATQEQLDEMDKEPVWRRFLRKFPKVK